MASTPFIWILFFLSFHISTARKVSTEVNPECGELCQKGTYPHGVPNLVYTKSEGEEDTLHHVWSTVGGSPSLLLLQAPSNESLNFTWNVQEEDIVPSITLSGEPLYAFALVFNKIWEYKDPKDKGTMTNTMSDVVSIDLSEFSWQNVSDTLNATEQYTSAFFQTQLNSSHIFEDKGLFSIQLETRGDSGRSDVIPRLLYTSNSTQACVLLDKLIPRFEESRYAVEVSVFVNEYVSPNADIFKEQSMKSMDDEYTPGVFKSMQLISKDSQDRQSGSYLSWKPVAYTSEDLSVTGSSGAVYYDFVKRNVSNSSLAESFFRENLFQLEEGIAFNVSFGTSQDGYYGSTKYTKWTFSYGLGLPGEDELSSLVKIVLASGLGLPMLLIILSCVYLAWHKINMKKDDLSLSSRR